MTGVPVGMAMSMPEWNLRSPKMGLILQPYSELTHPPSTGHMSFPRNLLVVAVVALLSCLLLITDSSSLDCFSSSASSFSHLTLSLWIWDR